MFRAAVVDVAVVGNSPMRKNLLVYFCSSSSVRIVIPCLKMASRCAISNKG